MPSQLYVSFLFQYLAERIGVKRGRIFAAAQELVKQRGRNPGFEYHPTTEVDAADLIVEHAFLTETAGRTGHGVIVGNELGKVCGGVVEPARLGDTGTELDRKNAHQQRDLHDGR